MDSAKPRKPSCACMGRRTRSESLPHARLNQQTDVAFQTFVDGRRYKVMYIPDDGRPFMIVSKWVDGPHRRISGELRRAGEVALPSRALRHHVLTHEPGYTLVGRYELRLRHGQPELDLARGREIFEREGNQPDLQRAAVAAVAQVLSGREDPLPLRLAQQGRLWMDACAGSSSERLPVSRTMLRAGAAIELDEHPWASIRTAKRLARDHLKVEPGYYVEDLLAESLPVPNRATQELIEALASRPVPLLVPWDVGPGRPRGTQLVQPAGRSWRIEYLSSEHEPAGLSEPMSYEEALLSAAQNGPLSEYEVADF